MKIKGLYLLAALCCLCSCTVSSLPEDPQSGPEFREVSILAGTMSKSVMKDDNVVWEDGDKISLIFIHPEKGAYVTELAAEIPEGEARVANFKGKLPVAVSTSKGYEENGYAVYPSSAVKADGKVSFYYGGDFNNYDATDNSFNNNGVFAADRRPHAHAYEVQRIQQDIHTTPVDVKNGVVEIYNERFFTDLKPYALEWELMCNGKPFKCGRIDNLDLKPQERKQLSLGYTQKDKSPYSIIHKYGDCSSE